MLYRIPYYLINHNSALSGQAALRLPYKRVVELRLVEPELSTEHLSAYYIGFIACGLSCILFVLLAVIRFFNYHRSTHLIYNFTMAKVSAAKVRQKIEMRNTISTAFRITYVGYFKAVTGIHLHGVGEFRE